MKHQDSKAMLLRKRKIEKLTAERGLALVLEYMECHPTLTRILRHRWKTTSNDFRIMMLFPNAPSPIYINSIKLGATLSKKPM